MLIAIISDTHGNNATFEKFAAWAKENKIQEIIHCGDIGFAYFAKAMAELLPDVHFNLVIGNMDNDAESIEKMLAPGQSPNTSFYGQTGEIEIDHEKIGFCRLINPGNLAGDIYQSTFAVYDTTIGLLELKITADLI